MSDLEARLAEVEAAMSQLLDPVMIQPGLYWTRRGIDHVSQVGSRLVIHTHHGMSQFSAEFASETEATENRERIERAPCRIPGSS